MNPTSLSENITVSGITKATNDYGDSVTTQVVKFSTWASIEPLTAKQMFLKGINTDRETYTMKHRYVAGRDIKKDDLVLWNGMQYVAQTKSQVDQIRRPTYFITEIQMASA